MRVFTIGLLLLNVGVAGWLIAVASMEFPPWEDAFEGTRSVLNCMDDGDGGAGSRRVLVDLTRARLEATEMWTRTAMAEYRRSELALSLLTLGNIAGLAVLSFWRGKGMRGARAAGEMEGR